MSAPPNREVVIFTAALELPAGERAAYLQKACADDPVLLLHLEALLRVQEEAAAFLETPVSGVPPPIEAEVPVATARLVGPPAEKAGDRIGRYKLLQQIGEGGCGVVFMAEQEEPVRRRVAIKVIKLGMDTKQVIARFEAERQVLALMDHPNIAKILDAGATETLVHEPQVGTSRCGVPARLPAGGTDDPLYASQPPDCAAESGADGAARRPYPPESVLSAGRPYFVMELVKGIPITRYCDENNLSTAKRLDLFVQVCQAIQHAHQKGIIHRDIKPSNILVADHDGVPVPKIIDFGIAKATTNQRLTDKTLFTAFEQFIGTPAYMSPEQAKLSGLDIDTRSDIYSLGVLLYELLTGKTPFEAKRLLEAGLDEVRRIIREEEPVQPSTMLHTLDTTEQTTVAKHRQSDPPKLIHLICGDLDWIVMKALEKDRGRRYETVNGLALDVQRHLNNEPVVACPPGTAYKVRKFIRRNRGKVVAAGTVAATLLLGITISAWQAVRATRAEWEQRRLQRTQMEAERARKTEADARHKEQELRGQVEASLELAKRYSYSRNMLLADRAWQAGDFHQTEEALAECAPDLRGWEWNYLKHQCHAESASVVIQTNGVQTMALAPGGDFVASVGADELLRVRTTMTGHEEILPTARTNPITGLILSADGRRLGVGYTNGLVEMWDVPGSHPVWSTNAHTSDVSALAFSQDGRRLASASRYGTVMIRGADSGELVKEFSMAKRAIKGLALSPDGRLLAATGEPYSKSDTGEPGEEDIGAKEYVGTIQVWDVATGREGPAFTNVLSAGECVAFSPNGQSLASGHRDGTIKLWKWDSQLHEAAESRSHLGSVLALAFNPDGSRLASGSADRTVSVWNLLTNQEPRTYGGHIDEVRSVAFTSDDSKVVSASQDGTVKMWDNASDPKVLTLPIRGRALAFNNTGKLLATSGSLWNLDTRTKESGDDYSRYISAFGRLAFSPDGKYIASSGPASVINVQTGALLWRSNDPGRAYGVAFSRDGTVLGIGSESGIVTLSEAATGKEISSFTWKTNSHNQIYDAAFSPDGSLMALAGGNFRMNGPHMYNALATGEPGEVQLWDWKLLRLVTTLNAHRFCVWAIAFSPDGRRIASAGGLYVRNTHAVGSQGEVQVSDVATGQEIFNLKGVVNNVFGIAFSPDGKRLVAVAGQLQESRTGNEFKIWDMESGLETFSLRGFPGTGYGVAFSPDGKSIAAIGSVLKIWSTQ